MTNLPRTRAHAEQDRDGTSRDAARLASTVRVTVRTMVHPLVALRPTSCSFSLHCMSNLGLFTSRESRLDCAGHPVLVRYVSPACVPRQGPTFLRH